MDSKVKRASVSLAMYEDDEYSNRMFIGNFLNIYQQSQSII